MGRAHQAKHTTNAGNLWTPPLRHLRTCCYSDSNCNARQHERQRIASRAIPFLSVLWYAVSMVFESGVNESAKGYCLQELLFKGLYLQFA
eukprot:5215473-Amphidinium_carterae.1